MNMKNIQIQRIEAVNFTSWKSLDFVFSGAGLFSIEGENGAGKTSIFEAVFYAFTGQTLKGDGYKDLLKHGQKEGNVTLHFEVSGEVYKICRNIHNTETSLYHFGNNISGKHKADTQQLIYNLLGCDANTLLNTVVFGQRMQRLLESGNSEKRDLFEALFDIDFVESSRENAQEIALKLTSKVTAITKDIQIKSELVSKLESEIEENKIVAANFEAEKKKELERAQNNILEYQNKIKEKQKEIELYKSTEKPNNDADLETCRLRMEEGKKKEREKEALRASLLSEKSRKVKEAESIENKLKTSVGDCPTCLQEIDTEKLKKHYSLELTRLGFDIMDLDLAANELDFQLNDIKENNNLLKDTLRASENRYQQYLKEEGEYLAAQRYIKLLNSNIEDLEKALKQSFEQLKRVEAMQPTVKPIKELREQINSLKQEISQLSEELEPTQKELERVQWWVKIGFGANGLKSYVFKYMLERLNNTMKKYCNLLGLDVHFTVNIEGKLKKFEAMCSLDGKTLPYSRFSGGEKTRIDLCIGFGMFDLLKSSKVNFNVLFLDEIFAGLDYEGKHAVFNIVKMMGENTGVYFVTHEGQFTQGVKKIEVVKENNSSKIL